MMMLELNQSITNPILVKAMDEFKKQPNPRTELDMIHAILAAKFLSPVKFSAPILDGKVPPNTSVQYYLLTNSKEEQFYMLFTDRGELEKWSKGEQRDTFTAPVQIFPELLKKSKESIKGVVINPFSQSIMLTGEMITNFPEAPGSPVEGSSAAVYSWKAEGGAGGTSGGSVQVL